MKKEYLILVALILILGAYLLLHKENKDNYVLPQIAKIDTSKITGLVIDKKPGAIKFTKKENAWLMTDKKYLANSSLVDTMLDTLKTFKLSALVSQKEDLKRYELDDEKNIKVKAMNGQKIAFEFSMGKTAPSFNHTFVRLANDKNVYHANGNFRSNFDKTVEDFRDKKVMGFKQESISQIAIEKDGLSKTLVSKKDKQADAITWLSDDGAPADKKMISTLLSGLSFLKCEKYLNSFTRKKLEEQEPLCKIRLKNEENLILTLFKTDTQDNLMGVSSMNEYVFELSQFTGKEIISNIDALLGITPKEKTKD
jgi:Domain of unknown function (DUF4340)